MEGVMGLFGSILGIAAQANAQQQQQNLGYQNLWETERENRFRDKLTTSSQTDAQGNQVYYDPGLKQWKIKLTPTTKGIVDAQQLEQGKSLTEDAPRNRAAAVRKDKRSIAAADDFERAFNDYKYRPQKSEDDFIGDATREALLSRRAGASEAASAVNRSLLRTGNGSDIPAVFKAARDADAQEFEDTLLGAKRQGQKDFLALGGANDAKAQQELEFLRGIADDTDTSPVRFGNDNERLQGSEANALAGQLSGVNQDQSSRTGAMDTLIKLAGQTPDFSSFASALSGLGRGMSGGGATGSVDGSGSGGQINPQWYMEMMRQGYMKPSVATGNDF
jgi:hypothetical protein